MATMFKNMPTRKSKLSGLLTGLFALISCATLFADPPAWWSQVGADGHSVINSSATDSNPLNAANIGQAKFMAKRALEALRPILPQTADTIEANLVGPGKPIPSWTVPAQGSATAKAQYAPLLVGQLKAISEPFYTALKDVDSEWLLNELEQNGTLDSSIADHFYPWTSQSDDDANKAIATIGQLKAVFSLRFESLVSTPSVDDIGVPDEDVVFEQEPDTENAPIANSIPPPPTNTFQSVSLGNTNYEIQFRKATRKLHKMGHEPIYESYPPSKTRYLNSSKRYFATDWYNNRILGAWRVGHYTSSSSFRYDFYYDTSRLDETVDPLTGIVTKYGYPGLDTSWWDWYHFSSEPHPDPNSPPGEIASDGEWMWWKLGSGSLWWGGVHWLYDAGTWYNGEFDGDAMMWYEHIVHNENTLSNVKSLALDNPPTISTASRWMEGVPTAGWNVWDTEMGVTYSIAQFRFRKKTNAPLRLIANVIFTPENGAPEQLIKTVRWTSEGSDKNRYVTLDPAKLKPNVEGQFHIEVGTIVFDLDQAQNGSTAIIPIDMENSGGGGPREVPSPILKFPGMSGYWLDNAATITLSKVAGSGPGKIRFLAGDEVVPFDTNLAADFFKPGGAWTGRKWTIEGVEPGELKIKLKYNRNGKSMSVTRSARVVSGDLDIDSDNSGIIESTVAEENIENDFTKSGKILLARSEWMNDSDGKPNSITGLSGIKIRTSGFASTDQIKFLYSGSNPTETTSSTQNGIATYTNAPGALRIWKITNGGTSASQYSYIDPGVSYSFSDLGIVPGTDEIFYVQGVSLISKKASIQVTMNAAGVVVSDRVVATIVPVRVVSRDRYLAGTIEVPEEWGDFSAEFVNTTTQENLGTYGSLLGGGTTKVYASVDGIMDDADLLSGGQSAAQKVWFVRDPSNTRRLDFYTCFNAVGTVEVRILRGGQTVLVQSHVLTAADDFAGVIRYVDDWVKGVGFEFGGSGGTIPAVMAAPAAYGEGSGGINNLTRAALIPFFNVINNVEGLQNIAIGLFDGFRVGLDDDWKLLILIKSGAVAAGNWAWQEAEAELIKWRDDPVKRAAELKGMAMRVCQEWVLGPLKGKIDQLSTWNGFKNQSWNLWQSVKGTVNKAWTVSGDTWKDVCKGFSTWLDDFGARMIEGAEKTHWSESVFPMDKFQQIANAGTTAGCYALGYSSGYVAEQVVIGVVTGGVVKGGAILTKGGAKMASLLAARRVLPVAARLHLLKKWAASTAMSIEMKATVERGLTEAAKVPLSTVVKESPLEIIETALRKPTVDRNIFSAKNLINELLPENNPKIHSLLVNEVTSAVPFQRLGFFLHMINDAVDTEMIKNFYKLLDRKMILDAGPNLDWLDDFLRATEGVPGRFNTLPPLVPPLGQWRVDIIREIIRPGGSIWTSPPVGFSPRGTIVEVHLARTAYREWIWSPTQAAVDFLKGGIAVQLKTLSTADSSAMKAALDALLGAHSSTPFEKMILDMRIKPGLDTTALRAELDNYIAGKVAADQSLVNKIEYIITEYELNPH